jgi:hypothetical protein
MKWMIFVLLLAGCSPSQNIQQSPILPVGIPQIIKQGLLQANGGENGLITFNNQVYDLSFDRIPPQVAIISMNTLQVNSTVQTPNLDLGSAVVVSGIVNVFQTYYPINNGEAPLGNYITRMISSDLINWSSPQIVIQLPSNEAADNTSVIQDGTGYLLARDDTYNEGNPSIFFYHSNDLVNWTPVGGVFSDNGYSATPALVYLNGYYYMFYCAYPMPFLYNDIKIARSVDLVNWEISPKVVLAPGPGEGISICNMSIVEFNGVVYMAYSVGDQQTWGNLNWATYNGTMQQLLSLFFQ